MNRVEEFIEKCAKKYKYRPLPDGISARARAWYLEHLPAFLKVEGSDEQLFSLEGTLICNGYTRVVIGDYGAFVEFTKEQAANDNYIVAPGQEWRMDKSQKYNIKYYWYTAKDNSGCKIYLQRGLVPYASYKRAHCYISPYQVKLGGTV